VIFFVLVVSACLGAFHARPGVDFGEDVGVTLKMRRPGISWFYPARRLRCSAEDLARTIPARYAGLLRHSYGRVRVRVTQAPLSLLSTFHFPLPRYLAMLSHLELQHLGCLFRVRHSTERRPTSNAMGCV